MSRAVGLAAPPRRAAAPPRRAALAAWARAGAQLPPPPGRPAVRLMRCWQPRRPPRRPVRVMQGRWPGACGRAPPTAQPPRPRTSGSLPGLPGRAPGPRAAADTRPRQPSRSHLCSASLRGLWWLQEPFLSRRNGQPGSREALLVTRSACVRLHGLGGGAGEAGREAERGGGRPVGRGASAATLDNSCPNTIFRACAHSIGALDGCPDRLHIAGRGASRPSTAPAARPSPALPAALQRR